MDNSTVIKSVGENENSTASLEYLYNLQKFGIKLGLGKIKALLQYAGNPQRTFPSVHVAGTNGKGSTASFLAAILTASGYRVGLYTSPHLVRFNERIRMNGEPIFDTHLVEYTEFFRPEIDDRRATFFEATTAIACTYFANQHVDIAVIETGLGGRLDATNVLVPILSIITNISLEHIEHLGETIEKITGEKAGIIKQGIPCFTAVRDTAALGVLQDVADDTKALLHMVSSESINEIEMTNFESMSFIAQDPSDQIRIHCGLVGKYQIENCLLARSAALYLKKNGWNRISESSMQSGLMQVKQISGIRARLDCISSSPEVIVDVAHNPDGFRAMLECYSLIRSTSSTHLAFGLLASKDHAAIAREILKYNWMSISILQPKIHETQSVDIITGDFASVENIIRKYTAVTEGMRSIMDGAKYHETILLCGSHYVVGEYLAALIEK